MARTRTLAELRAEVRQRADLVGANARVSNAEIDRFINQSIADLWDLLRDHSPGDWALAFEDVSFSAGIDVALLPDDFYLMRGVDYHSGSARVTMRPFDFRDRNQYRGVSSGGTGSTPFQYRVSNSVDEDGARTPALFLIPTPASAITVTVWYLQHAPVLDEDTDVWDGFNGWEEYVVLDATAKAMELDQNQPSDIAPVLQRFARIRDRIIGLSAHQDLTENLKVKDVLPDELDLWYEEDGRRFL